MKKSIPASSSHWDGKQITLTPTTKRNIEKKAFVLDAETMTGMPEEQALGVLEQQGMTIVRLVETEGTYSNNAQKAIELLEANKSAGGRVQAIQALQQLGYTNIYEANTEDFITPPESEPKEEPSQPAEPNEPAWKSNPYFNRGAKTEKAVSTAKQVAWETAKRIKDQNAKVMQMQEMEAQQFQSDKSAQRSQFIQSMVPRVAGAVKRNEMTNFRSPSQVRSPVVSAYPNRQVMQPRQSVMQPQQAFDPNKEAVKRFGLNPGVAAKFNMARRNVVQNVQPRLPPSSPPRNVVGGMPKANQNMMGKFSFKPRVKR